MNLVFFLTAVIMFVACLCHANEMSGKSPAGLIIGLVLMMIGDVGYALFALYSMGRQPDFEHMAFMTLGAFFINGATLWFICNRRQVRREGGKCHQHS